MSKLPSDLEHWLRWVEHENPEPEPYDAASKGYQLLSDTSWSVLREAALLIQERNQGQDSECGCLVAWALSEFPEALVALTRALYAPYAEMCEAVPECVVNYDVITYENSTDIKIR